MCTDIESIKEVAKATQEVAKTTSHAITASQEVGGFYQNSSLAPWNNVRTLLKINYVILDGKDRSD